MSGGGVRLVVQGDDFGMCHAVNEGVARASAEGILTQSSVMAACPWVDEAAVLARELGIRVGLHQTLTCEWERLRWGPLTAAPSLRSGDGTFPRTVEAASACDPAEAAAELEAQAGRASALGLSLDYLDVHMGLVCPPAYQSVSETLGVPFLYPGLPTSLRFDSIAMLSERPAADKKGWLEGWLTSRRPGVHLLVCHPAVASGELSAITGDSDGRLAAWAVDYRLSDLDVLTDPSIAGLIDSAGIELVSVSQLS